MYLCKECGEWDYEMRDDGQCFVCWNMEHHPEDFTMTEQQAKEMDECAAYIQKHNIQPNLDIPE